MEVRYIEGPDWAFPSSSHHSLLGSLSTDDGNGSENVTLKMSSRFFKFFLVYSNSFEMSKVGEFRWS